MEKIKDIVSREDIVVLINLFYERVNKDELLAPVFAHVDWQEHLPTMYDFWASMMLGEQTYRGNPFQKHRNLAITSRHFDQWLKLFVLTVNENFSGENAEEIKKRAINIASVFQFKMGLIPNTDNPKSLL